MKKQGLPRCSPRAPVLSGRQVPFRGSENLFFALGVTTVAFATHCGTEHISIGDRPFVDGSVGGANSSSTIGIGGSAVTSGGAVTAGGASTIDGGSVSDSSAGGSIVSGGGGAGGSSLGGSRSAGGTRNSEGGGNASGVGGRAGSSGSSSEAGSSGVGGLSDGGGAGAPSELDCVAAVQSAQAIVAAHRECSNDADCHIVRLYFCAPGECSNALYVNQGLDQSAVAELQTRLNFCAASDPNAVCTLCPMPDADPVCVAMKCAPRP